MESPDELSPEVLPDDVTQEDTLTARIQHGVSSWCDLHRGDVRLCTLVGLGVVASAYLAFCMYTDLQGSIPLIVFAAIFVTMGTYYLVKWRWGGYISKQWLLPVQTRVAKIWMGGGRWWVTSGHNESHLSIDSFSHKDPIVSQVHKGDVVMPIPQSP